jgi:hypothetical protein
LYGVCSRTPAPQWGALNRQSSGRVLIDAATGEQVVVPKSADSLFFIRMEWWGAILAAIAVATAAYRLAHG